MNGTLFKAIARALFTGITKSGKSLTIKRTSISGLRTAFFRDTGGKPVLAIEQNPNKPSLWGKLAREGHEVVQFRENGNYVGVAVDGKVLCYTRSLGTLTPKK